MVIPHSHHSAHARDNVVMLFESAVSEAARFGLTVTWGNVPDNLVDKPEKPRWIQVRGDDALVRLPEGWRVLVSAGLDIVIQKPQTLDVSDDTVDYSWILDTWALPIAMMQRGWLALHASTVEVHGLTIALAGNSGAGKSTTALGLRARGHRYLVDETTLCEVTSDRVVVHPYRRRPHLTDEAVAYFGISKAQAVPLSLNPKVSIAPDTGDVDSRTLDHILILTPPKSAGGETAVRPLEPSAALPQLKVLTERRGLAPKIYGPRGYLDLLTGLAKSTEVSVLTRPPGAWTLDEVLDRVEGMATDAARTRSP